MAGIKGDCYTLCLCAFFFDVIRQTLRCFANGINVQAVAASADDTAEAACAKFQLFIEPFLDFRVVSGNAFQFRLGFFVNGGVCQPLTVSLLIFHKIASFVSLICVRPQDSAPHPARDVFSALFRSALNERPLPLRLPRRCAAEYKIQNRACKKLRIEFPRFSSFSIHRTKCGGKLCAGRSGVGRKAPVGGTPVAFYSKTALTCAAGPFMAMACSYVS